MKRSSEPPAKEPKDIEIEAEEVEANRLYICRQFRNYLSHVPDPGFLVPTDKMLKFLQGKVDTLKSHKSAAGSPLRKGWEESGYWELNRKEKGYYRD